MSALCFFFFFWLFWGEVASFCPGTLFLLTEKRFRSDFGPWVSVCLWRGSELGCAGDGEGLSTDLDTITVPSSLLPHHFWQCFCCATGNRKARLSGRRFGQSGIKCRALFSHSVLRVDTPGDLHCAFSHTSLRGATGILRLWKESG